MWEGCGIIVVCVYVVVNGDVVVNDFVVFDDGDEVEVLRENVDVVWGW